MKRMLMVIAAMMSWCVLADTWTDPDTGITWTYTVSDGNVTLGDGSSSTAISTSTSGAIAIPKVIAGFPVKSVGEKAFSCCCNLTSVLIPEGVTNIGSVAFFCCRGLTSVTIPASVTSIGPRAFMSCSGMFKFTVSESNQNYMSINGLLLSKDGKTLINGANGEITIPYGVTNIEVYAFYECSGLMSVTMPESVTSIGALAFCDCSGLLSVTIPNGVTSIGNSAFCGCSGLTEVTIPEGVTSIEGSAFYGCSGLTEVTIPEGVTSIGGSAFRDCSGLTSVAIPVSVTSIGAFAFSGCSGLGSGVVIVDGCVLCVNGVCPSVVALPTGTRLIAGGVFQDCSGLMSVTIPEGVTSIGAQAFWGCTGLTSVTIPASVTSVEENAFSFCSGIQQFVVDEANPNYSSIDGLLLTKDGKTLMQGVNKSNISIPEGVTSIRSYAFEGCSDLTSVTISSSVTSIGYSAFRGSSSLTDVFFDGNAPTMGNSVFEDCDAVCTAYVKKDSTGWGVDIPGIWMGINIAYLVKPDGGPYKETVDGIEWTFMVSGGNASVGGQSGATAIPTSTTGAIVIPSTLGGCQVTSVGYSAFRDCKGLSSLRIPEGVTNIGNCAFINCSGLKSVTIPSSMTRIDDCAFSDCKGLTSIAIPSSVTSIGNYAFFGCSGLTSISFDGDAPLHWSPNAFDYCADGLTLYVAKDSTGWGVDIPGTWNGINIAYYTAYNVEGAGEVKIHDDWVEKYAPGKSEEEVTELLAQTAANGKYKNWECYALGLDPTNAESKIVVSAQQSQDSGSISVSLNLNVPAGCGYTVSNEVTVVGGSGGHVVTALPNGFTIDLTGDGDPSGLYTIKVKLVPNGSSTSTSEIEVEQTVGVRKSTSELTKTAIAVPWGELTGKGAQSICVSNIVKTANLTAGDKLHVYNTSSRAYETWQLSDNLTWEPLATYVILEDGSVSKVSAGAPTTTMIARGSAVWLERQDTSKPFYLYGEYQSGTIETSIVGGTTATPVWNFVAPPTLGDFDLNNITGASEDDKIVVTTANGPKIYTYKQGAWGSDVNTTEKRTLPGGGTIEVVKKTRDTSNTTISAGAGFMYVSQGGSPTINW